jgi:hypothetical protein
MKRAATILSAIFVLLPCGLHADSPRPPTIQVTSLGDARSLDETQQGRVKFWLQQLMISALYRTAVQESSLDEWKRALSAPSRIQCRYASEVTLAIPQKPALVFSEVLLPSHGGSYPAYIFVRRDETVFRLAHYDPWVLYKLGSESGVPLGLATVERTLF